MQSPEYHEAWKVQARDVLARAEFRKRKLTQRVSCDSFLTHCFLVMSSIKHAV